MRIYTVFFEYTKLAIIICHYFYFCFCFYLISKTQLIFDKYFYTDDC